MVFIWYLVICTLTALFCPLWPVRKYINWKCMLYTPTLLAKVWLHHNYIIWLSFYICRFQHFDLFPTLCLKFQHFDWFDILTQTSTFWIYSYLWTKISTFSMFRSSWYFPLKCQHFDYFKMNEIPRSHSGTWYCTWPNQCERVPFFIIRGDTFRDTKSTISVKKKKKVFKVLKIISNSYFSQTLTTMSTRWFWNHESRLNIHQSMWIQWPFLQKLEPKVIDP